MNNLRNTLLIVLVLTMAAPAAALPLDALGASTQASIDTIQDDARSQRAQGMFAAGAYLTPLTTAGVDDAYRIQAVLWEAAQGETDPSQAFHDAAITIWDTRMVELNNAAIRLDQASTGSTTVAEAQSLLMAAHLLVQSELDHEMAAKILVGGAAAEYHRYPEQRMVFIRNLAVVDHQLRAFHAVLDDMAPGGVMRDWAPLALQLQAAESQHAWHRPAGGVFHELVRHGALAEQPVTGTSIEGLQRANEVPIADSGQGEPLAAWSQALQMDVAWWVQELGPEPEESQMALVENLEAALRAARYESSVLAARDNSGLDLKWIVAGIVVALILAAVLWGPKAGRKLRLLVVGGIVLLILPLASAEPLPADARETAIALTQPEAPGAWGTVATDGPDIRFAWVSCETPTAGCYDVWTRTFDPEVLAWTAPEKILDQAYNLSMPLYLPDAGYILWQDRAGPNLALRGCFLTDCTPEVIGPAGADNGNARAQLDASGRVWVLWQSEAGDEKAVKYRVRDAAGWGPIMQVPGGGQQTLGALWAGSEVHATWFAGASSLVSDSSGEVRHARLDTDGDYDTIAQVPIERSSSVAVKSDGTLGVLYSQAGDVRASEFIDGAWSTAVNISRTPGKAGDRDLQLMPEGDGWAAVWRTGARGNMALMAAHEEGGFWLAPVNTMPPAFAEWVLFPTYAASNGLHLAWTGLGPGASQFELHYRYVSEAPGAPPVVAKTVPLHGAWVNSATVSVQAQIESTAPLNMEATSLKIDGQEQPFERTVSGGVQMLSAAIDGLAEGEHRADWSIVDEDGGTTPHQTMFYVDTVRPSFAMSYSLDGVAVGPPQGWEKAPLDLIPSVADDGGSPVAVQVSFDDGVTYVSPDATILEPQGDGYRLPANGLYSLRFRAIDSAGNGAAAPAIRSGWDAETPAIAMHAPRWVAGPAEVHIDFDQAGSKVTAWAAAFASEGEISNVTLADSGVAHITLPEGTFTIRVGGFDAAGNQAAGHEAIVTIDTKAPTLMLTGTSIKVHDGGGLFAIAIDGEPVQFTIGNTSFEIDAALAGNAIGIMAMDQAGNSQRAMFDTGTGELSMHAPMLPEDATVESANQNQESPMFIWLALVAVMFVAAARRR